MDLIKVTKNKERVKSILKMVGLIEERIGFGNRVKFSSLILLDYYEIIKELLTALLLCDGFKTLSHKDLIGYLKLNYSGFTTYEITFFDRLRIVRNRIAYEGFEVSNDLLKDNESNYIQIIKKLKKLTKERLEG